MCRGNYSEENYLKAMKNRNSELDGIIKEFGTHEELMKLEKGKYREMFISQAEKYIGGNND